MKKISIAIVSCIAFGVISQPVFAHKSTQIEEKTAEFTAANTDTSNDLTLAELSIYIANRTANRFTTLDTSEDGVIDLDEFTANTTAKTIDFATELFSLSDLDADGNLDTNEFATTEQGNSEGEIIHYFARLDKNLDLLVSLQEYINLKKPEAHSLKKPESHGHKKPGHH